MALAAPYSPVGPTEALERLLGDPNDPCQAFSYARCGEFDEAAEFPGPICRDLDAIGLPGWFVPAEHGGELRHAEQLWQIIRVLARRDFTVALGHVKTYLGAVSVWVAGDRDQAYALGERIRAGAVVSLALTEREHGSDLLSGELVAVRTPGGYRLDGEKWLINNATRAGLVCVLARTGEAGGARGFSLLLVDKARLEPGEFRCLPKVATHGVRGADISGIAFSGAQVPADALVGAEGTGLETILKGFQITRTLCSAMSVGMAEHGLRLAVDFARSHRLYGRALVELPHTARALAEAYTDLLAAEAVSLLATRSIPVLGGEQSVTSAIVKYLVPTAVDELIAGLGKVLGARAMLVDDHADGAFQKLERDHRIVGIFDGSTAVNLTAVINQFPSLVRGYRAAVADDEGLAAASRLTEPPPALDPAKLTLYSRTGCSVVQALPALVAGLGNDVPRAIVAKAVRLRELGDSLHEELAAYRPVGRAVPEHAFGAARRYALVYAASACLFLWWHNRSATELGQLSGVDWLDAALARLLGRLRPRPDYDDEDGAAYDRLLPKLLAQADSGGALSLLDCDVAEEPS
jgi:alkylation response protein AidB-like acyl-CoA dehydrogenase